MGTGPGLSLSAQLSQARGNLAATNLKCSDGNEYALAGGGFNGNALFKTVDIYTNDGILTRTNDNFEGPARSSLAATTITCSNGNQYALFGGGFYNNGNDVYSNNVDVFACNEDGVYQNDNFLFEGPGRQELAATIIRCGNDEYALFGGGVYTNNDDNDIYTNNVDVFACNEDGVYQNDNLLFEGPGRENLAATTIRCGNDEYALFGGGSYFDGITVYSNNVDVFACNADGVYHNDNLLFKESPIIETETVEYDVTVQNVGGVNIFLLNGVNNPVITMKRGSTYIFNQSDNSNNNHPLRFQESNSPYSKGVTVTGTAGQAGSSVTFKPPYPDTLSNFSYYCSVHGNAMGNTIIMNNPTITDRSKRSDLAATTIRCGNTEYALFGGGFYSNENDVYSNNVDVFACNADGVYHNDNLQFEGPGRKGLVATTISCPDGKQYALFGGGSYFDGNDVYSNHVDVFLCNENGVYHKEVIQFTGPGRADLAATTITIDGKQYSLFMGGETGNGEYSDAIDIYDCAIGNFLPQP